MKSLIASSLLSASLFLMPIIMAGCEVSHSESTKQNLLGGETHEETTVTRNPDGSLNVDKSKQVTR